MENKDKKIKGLIAELDSQFDDGATFATNPAFICEFEKVAAYTRKQKKASTKKLKRLTINHTRRRVIAACVACTLLALIIVPVIDQIRAFTYERFRMSIAQNRVNTAQYTPNIDILTAPQGLGESSILALAESDLENSVKPAAKDSLPSATAFGGSDLMDSLGSVEAQVAPSDNDNTIFTVDTDITREDYEEIVGVIGVINTGGTYDESISFRSVYEIKDELFRVLSILPRFNHWYQTRDFFRYSYYAEMDEQQNRLTLTRVTASWYADYWDFDAQKAKNTRHIAYGAQHQIIKVDYYFDELNREVVEFEAYNFYVTKDGYVPLMYQVMKNVKDTSFTKIDIIAGPDLQDYNTDRYKSGIPGGDNTFDLRQTTPYGAQRAFTQLDYQHPEDIQLLMVTQLLPYDLEEAPARDTSIKYYNKSGKNSVYYSTWYNYAAEQSFKMIDNYNFFPPIDDTYVWKNTPLESYYKTGSIVNAFLYQLQLSPHYIFGIKGVESTTDIAYKYTGIISTNDKTAFFVMPYAHYYETDLHQYEIEFKYGIECNSNMFDVSYPIEWDEEIISSINPTFNMNKPIPKSSAYVVDLRTDSTDFSAVSAILENESLPLNQDGKTVINNGMAIPIQLSSTLSTLGRVAGTNELEIDTLASKTPAALSFDDTEYNYEAAIDAYLDAVSITVVENSFLAQNVEQIYKAKLYTAWRYGIGSGDKSAMSEVVTLNDFNSSVLINDNWATVSVSATIEPNITLSLKPEYSLALIMQNESGDSYIFGTSAPQKYINSKPLIFDITETFALDINQIIPSGRYTLGIALTTYDGFKDVICSNFAPVFADEASELSTTTVPSINGFKTSISYALEQNKVIINVVTTDTEPPTILSNQHIDIILLDANSIMLDALKHFTISDNDRIASITIKNSNLQVMAINEKATSGQYTLIVTDHSNHKSSITFTIITEDFVLDFYDYS